MNGVTVIAEHTVKDYLGWLQVAVMAGLATIVVVGCFFMVIKDHDIPIAILCLTAGISFATICVLSTKEYLAKNTHIEYTVTIDDTTRYNEFIETYEILFEEDGVYHVKLREDNQ